MSNIPNTRRALDPVIWKRLVQRQSNCTNITPEKTQYTKCQNRNRNRNLSNGRIWNRLNFQSTRTCNPFRFFSSVSDSDTTQGSNHTKEDEKEPQPQPLNVNKQNIVVMNDFPYQDDTGDDGDENMDSDDEDDMETEELAQSAPQHLQSYMEKQEALITKYVNISSHLGNYVIDVHEAEEIRSCIKFLEARAKRRRQSRAEVERAFRDASDAEKLLDLLLHSSTSQHGIQTSFVTVMDFNKVLNTWRFSTLDLRIYLKSKKGKNMKEHFEQMLRYQRRIACRCIYASQCAQRLLDQMEDLTSNGYSFLRPTQYSYETVLGSWSFSSRALNFVLRGEGKAIGALRKIPPRNTLNDNEPGLAHNPWDDPTLLDGYTLLDPAKKADELLQRLVAMEELDGSEFKVSPWAIKQTISSWVQVKTRPRRFMKLDNVGQSKGDDEEFSKQFNEELRVPARAEELLWQLVAVSNAEELDGGTVTIGNGLFRGIISSWSHSNHPDGHLNAERILTKMGELYEVGTLNTMPSPDLFNAVIGSWARRSQSMPFDAPARCTAIIKHMEGIADNNLIVHAEEGQDNSELSVKWSKFHVDEKSYLITFGAFKSSLHCRELTESEDAFIIAAQADEMLQHMINRVKCGKDEARPTGEIYATVAACYGKAIEFLSEELSREHDVLKEAGVDFIGVEGHTKLTSALVRLHSLLEEMESGLGRHDANPDLSINAYTEVLRAWNNVTLHPDSQEEVLRIVTRVIDLYENGNQHLSPTSDMFDMAINTLLRNGSPANTFEAFELLQEQERLHLEGNPSCKPSIQNYRSILSAFDDKPQEVARVLKRMTVLYESNVVDELHAERGNTSLGFHELLELWQNVDKSGGDAASWAESMLLRVAKDVHESNSRCSDSTKLLRTKNFNAVIKAWLEAGEIHRAANLFDEMDELGKHPLLSDVKPDHLSFHLLIKGWTDSRSLFVGEKTVSLLERMRANNKNPSLVTFRLVLEALVHTSKDRCPGVAQAELILRNIDSKAVGREHSLRPNAKLANMVLQGWAQSKERKKGIRARALLDWMLNENRSGNPFIKPNFPSYNSVMSACVRTSKHLDPREKRRNFDIVLRTFEDLTKADHLKPGSVSYRIMLSACHALLPPGSEQQNRVKAIFQHCCRVGVVDEYLYAIFLESSDKDTFKEIMEKDHDVSYAVLPKEWKRNCKIPL